MAKRYIQITPGEFLVKFKEGERDFRNIELPAGTRLTKLPHYSNLVSNYKEPLNLSGASLIGLHATKINLSRADLTNADLAYSTLRRAKFCNARADGAQISSSNLSNSLMYGLLANGLNMNGARLFNVWLEKARLLNTSMREADLWNTDLSDSVLYRVSFEGASLENVRFEGSTSIDTDLSDVRYLESAKGIKNSRLVNPILCDVNLRVIQDVFRESKDSPATIAA